MPARAAGPPKPRRHGFELPLDPLQVVSWVTFLAMGADLAVLYAPIYMRAGDITAIIGGALCVVYLAPFLASWWYATQCMLIDPADPGDAYKADDSIPIDTRYCSACERHVKPRSRHCLSCRKCVDQYDHHCPWLNTCIGRHNYSAFIVLVHSLVVLTSMHIALLTHAGIYLATTTPLARQELAQTIGMPSRSYFIALVISGVVGLVIVEQLLELVCLHRRLQTRGITTYEYFRDGPDPLCQEAVCTWIRATMSVKTRVAPDAPAGHTSSRAV